MMQRHVFDGTTRVSQKSLEDQAVSRWLPPAIDKGGKLIQAEPRNESPLRQAVGQTAGKTADAAGNKPVSGTTSGSAAESLQAYDQAREEGLLAGRQEGLKKGLEEGRLQGHAQGLQQGLEEGHREGLENGRTQGLQQAETEIRQQLRVLNGMMTHLSHAVNEQDYQLEQALLNLSREIARHVVQRELIIDSSHIMAIVKQALATLPPSRDNVRILINPADQALVQKAAQEGGENWRVIANQHIARGGCRVETDQSAVDFTTGERFTQVVEQIVQRQFAGAEEQSEVPAGESFEDAPEPVVRASRLQQAAIPERSSLADEAEQLSADAIDPVDLIDGDPTDIDPTDKSAAPGKS